MRELAQGADKISVKELNFSLKFITETAPFILKSVKAGK